MPEQPKKDKKKKKKYEKPYMETSKAFEARAGGCLKMVDDPSDPGGTCDLGAGAS